MHWIQSYRTAVIVLLLSNAHAFSILHWQFWMSIHNLLTCYICMHACTGGTVRNINSIFSTSHWISPFSVRHLCRPNYLLAKAIEFEFEFIIMQINLCEPTNDYFDGIPIWKSYNLLYCSLFHDLYVKITYFSKRPWLEMRLISFFPWNPLEIMSNKVVKTNSTLIRNRD